MPRKQKTIHYLYKTTCLISNRFYIGIHSTNDINDGYMGSGKQLHYSLRKYGINNHKKEMDKNNLSTFFSLECISFSYAIASFSVLGNSVQLLS